MRVNVKMFAGARDAAGAHEVTVEVDERATVADLRDAIIASRPQLSQLIDRAMFAINEKYATDDDSLTADCEVACIPPVSGG
jgi:sulfur-carrier protein